ncbi:Ankyrin repeat domain-containing protein 39 [Bulinus truncatus]|nr:Ankyrin repeat domain-containing protein 39 [Bulinus truncatus]
MCIFSHKTQKTIISLVMSKHGGAHGCSDGDDHKCLFKSTHSSLHQNLEELDFERGLWPLAVSGDNVQLENKLTKSSGYNVNSRDNYGYTALHYASRNGHLDVCQTLLNYHADVNIVTQGSGTTPLHRAAYMGHSEIVELLLANSADPSIEDCDGMTPLHKSAENGHVQTFEILYRSNPSTVSTTDKKGRTVLDVAKSAEIKSKLLSVTLKRHDVKLH